MWQLLLNEQLFTAPCSTISSVLDLGCGSAVWTAAVAASFPDATVVGVDITPPVRDFGLKNLTILSGNVEKQWAFADKQRSLYDLITIRVLAVAIQDWTSLIQRSFEHLKPGGWIEIPDVTMGIFSDAFDWRDESSPFMRLWQCFRKVAASSGVDSNANQKRIPVLAAAGFTNISEKFIKAHSDEDAAEDHKNKEMARITRQNIFGLLEGITKGMQGRDHPDILQITDDELQQLKEDAMQEFMETSASRNYYIYW